MVNENVAEFDKTEFDDVFFPSGKLSYVTRLIHEIERLMLDSTLYNNDNYSTLKNKEVELDFRYEIVNNACLEYEMLGEEQKCKMEKWKYEKLQPYHKIKINLKDFFERLKNLEKQARSLEEKVSQHDSISQISFKSSSSISFKLAKEKAKIQAEKIFQKRQEDLESKRKELEKMQKELENERKSKYISYLENNLADMGEIERVCVANMEENQISNTGNTYRNKNYIDETNVHHSTKNDVFTSQNDEGNMKTLIKLFESMNAPKCEPIVFDGKDPSKYNNFKLSFDATIASVTTDENKLYFSLLKYTSDYANQIVQNYINSQSRYESAVKALDKDFGNEYVVASQIFKRLDEMPNIRNENARDLKDLALFLRSCFNSNNKVLQNYLSSNSELIKIVRKLPYKLQEKFRHRAHDIMDNNYLCDALPNFQDLLLFIERESSILSTPIYGELFITWKQESNPINKETKGKMKMIKVSLEIMIEI